MPSDQNLIQALDQSPLSPEDINHWKKLLPKLNTEQKERLLHNLTTKTEIKRIINLIEKALKIIAEAENEAQREISSEKTQNQEKDELLKELEEIKSKENEILFDEKTLKQKQTHTNQEIARIREELKNLSLEVQGQTPPSYQKLQPSA